jgi:hypothetical protein
MAYFFNARHYDEGVGEMDSPDITKYLCYRDYIDIRPKSLQKLAKREFKLLCKEYPKITPLYDITSCLV